MNFRTYIRIILVFLVTGIFVLMAERKNSPAVKQKRAHSVKDGNENIQPEFIIWESLGSTVLACSQ